MRKEHPTTRAFASPACALPASDIGRGFERDFAATSGPTSVESLNRWRRAMRANLIAARVALSSATRRRAEDAIAEQLDALLDRRLAALPGGGKAVVISAYLPYRGEPDIRAWMRRRHDNGAKIALPAVERKAQPLVFRQWTPTSKLEPGMLGIPSPADGRLLTPDVIIAPLVGYDLAGHRLGNGGGYFDRTLADLSPRPFAIGVGFSNAAIVTINPQAYDIAMDAIVVGDVLNRQ